MPEVISLGEMMVMFVATDIGPLRSAVTFEKHVAGAEANVAIGLARLGHSAGWISRLGDDEFGRYILTFLRGEGVDVSHVELEPEAPTGVAFKERREVGPRRVIYYRRGSAASRMTPAILDREYLRTARYLHLTGITTALSPSCHETVRAAMRLARDLGVLVSFDPNIRLQLRPAAEWRTVLTDLLPLCDLVLPGRDEATLITGEEDPERAARAILAYGPRLVVVKLGAEGALAVTPETAVHVPGVRLPRIVDPVGAGDGFAAGFLAGQLRGFDLPQSLRLANTVGAMAMTVLGDVEGLPTWREVQEFSVEQDVRR